MVNNDTQNKDGFKIVFIVFLTVVKVFFSVVNFKSLKIRQTNSNVNSCLLYTSDAADE